MVMAYNGLLIGLLIFVFGVSERVRDRKHMSFKMFYSEYWVMITTIITLILIGTFEFIRLG